MRKRSAKAPLANLTTPVRSMPMTWSFYGGTLDLKNRTMDNVLFAFALEPKKLRTMMDELDSLPAGAAKELDAAVAPVWSKTQSV